MKSQTLPLAGVRVVEFSHMVMGPTCGMILGDLGAEVIKVEPISGDNTRRLIGTGAGFFRMFNRKVNTLVKSKGVPWLVREVSHLLSWFRSPLPDMPLAARMAWARFWRGAGWQDGRAYERGWQTLQSLPISSAS
jgi:hypothetical protein